MPIKTLPSQAYLRQHFDYDPDTGLLRRKTGPRTGRIVTPPKGGGRIEVRVGDQKFFAYRVIWKWVTGEEPPPTLDHKDTNPTNDRWDNLRPATESQQKWNQNVARHGVEKHGRKYRAKVGRNTRIGSFDTEEEAAKAAADARQERAGEFLRAKPPRGPSR